MRRKGRSVFICDMPGSPRSRVRSGKPCRLLGSAPLGDAFFAAPECIAFLLPARTDRASAGLSGKEWEGGAVINVT